MFRYLLKGASTAGKFLFFSQVLNRKTGAQLLNNDEVNSFLSSRNKGLLLDGVSRRLSVKESYQNVLMSARVGAGKTTKYIVSNVLDKASQNCSIVVHDPKGEVHQLTSGYLQSKGFRVVLYDVLDPKNSESFNPCWDVQNEVEIEQIAQTIVIAANGAQGDQFWNNGAIRILSVLLKILSYGQAKHFNLVNLYHLMQHAGDLGKGLNPWVAKNGWNPAYPDDPYLIKEWKAAMTGNKEGVNSFILNATMALKAFTNRDIKEFFHTSSYRIADLRKEKTAIFFVTPPENQAYYSFVTSLFFKTIFNECMRREHLGKNTLDTYLLYDEFGNSFIPDFMSIATTIRGYRVSLSIILQTISQLSAKYGKEGSAVIQGAMNTNVCLSGADPETADYFSKVSGKVVDVQYHKRGEPRSTHSEYNLINPNEVRTMDEDKILIISKNRNPAIVPIKAFYEVRKWKTKTRYEPAQIQSRVIPDRLSLVEIP